MAYTIDWIGDVAFGVRTEQGRAIGFSLEEGQQVPQEFKEGDAVEIANRPAHPANIQMDMNDGFYEIKHIASGRTLRVYHRADQWRVKS
jgi:hypothetical protein